MNINAIKHSLITTVCTSLFALTSASALAGVDKVVPVENVKWEKLNPARGDKSPKAGTLWGDRKGKVATGFLAKFLDGFSSPPHIHNVSYRATYIIDEEGVVFHEGVNHMPIGRNVNEYLRIIDALTHVQEKGEVCPANWEDGKEAMNANRDSVQSYLSNN